MHHQFKLFCFQHQPHCKIFWFSYSEVLYRNAYYTFWQHYIFHLGKYCSLNCVQFPSTLLLHSLLNLVKIIVFSTILYSTKIGLRIIARSNNFIFNVLLTTVVLIVSHLQHLDKKNFQSLLEKNDFLFETSDDGWRRPHLTLLLKNPTLWLHFFFKTFFFQSSFRFIAKLRRRYRAFPHTPITSLLIDILLPSSTFATVDEPALTYHSHPKFLVYVRVHACKCCTFYGFG